MSTVPVLDVKNISVSFSQYSGLLKKSQLEVIRDLSVSIHQGELVAVVGASGSGKSLLAHAILGLLPYNASVQGEIRYNGELLTAQKLKNLRGTEIVLVPQSVSFLDPLMKVGPQLRKGKKTTALLEKSAKTLRRYGLDPAVEKQYPFELSGGMARRVLIGTAVMESPKLVIADEPTPGLHMSVAKRVLSHFRELADDGAAVLLITHDLELAAEVADRVVVFYAGTTIEEARVSDFADETLLRHPYTKALWRAMPKNGFQAIAGRQPYAAKVQNGCVFRAHCAQATSYCENNIPYRPLNGGFVRCIQKEGAYASGS